MKRFLPQLLFVLLICVCGRAQQTNHLDALINQLNYLEGKLKASDQSFFGRATEGMQALYDAKDYLKKAGWPDFEGEDAQYNSLSDAFYKVKVAERKNLLKLIDAVKDQLFKYKKHIVDRFNATYARSPQQTQAQFEIAEDPIGTEKRARLQQQSQQQQTQNQQDQTYRQQSPPPQSQPAPTPKPQPQYDYSSRLTNSVSKSNSKSTSNNNTNSSLSHSLRQHRRHHLHLRHSLSCHPNSQCDKVDLYNQPVDGNITSLIYKR